MRAYKVLTALVLGIVVSSVSCSSGRSKPGGDLGSQNELNVEQMRAAGALDALEAVQRLRPLWLRTRSQSSINSPNTILVYLNETKLGGIDALRGYPLESIVKMTYLSASEAANKLLGTGTTVVDGAIIISTRK